MNNNIIQAVSSTILHIRSKDAEQLQDGYNTHFRVILKNPVLIPSGFECHASTMSAEIPYSFYNISSHLGNDTLRYNETNLTFTTQDYSIDEIVDFFEANTAFKAIFTTTYNRQKNKITFSNTTGTEATLQLNSSSSTINKVIGFDEYSKQDAVAVAGGASTTSPFICNLATVHSVMIHASIGSGNVLSTRASNSTTIQKISVDTNSGGIVYMNQQDFRQVSISQLPIIDVIEFRFTDQNNNLLQLNNCNFEFSLLFEIFEKYKFNNNKIRQIIQPISRQGISTQPINITRPIITRPDIDSSHPIENTTEIEHKGNRIVLDELIRQIENNL